MSEIEKTKPEKKKTKKILKFKILIVFVVLLLVLGVALVFTIAKLYRGNMEDYYTDYAFSQASIIADYIDGDKLNEYYTLSKEGKPSDEIKDDYYYEVQNYLQSTSEKTGAEYTYIVVPEEKVHVYVWDSGTGDEVCEIGDVEEYYGEGDQIMHAAFSADADKVILVTNNDTYGYLASAYVPILDSKGNPVGLSSIDISMDMINSNIRRFVIYAAIVEAVVLLVAGAAYVIYIEKIIIKPVDILKKATVQIRKTDIEKLADVRVDLKTNDELEDLGNAFSYMTYKLSESIRNLQEITAEKNRIGAELDVAANIQSSMLPTIFPAPPENELIDIYATMDPAKEVGGDFYDFFFIDERHLAIVVADVSGKGIPASLFMVIGKTLIKDHTLINNDLGEVFSKVNNMLCEANSQGLFITAFEGVLDLVTGDFTFVNAGHEMPFISKNGGHFEPYKIKPGFVLAGMEDMKYTAGELKLEPGDKIFQYTDGVTEATSLDKELFGMQRLEDALDTVKTSMPKEILPAVKKAIDDFVGEAPQFDDITMLCLEYKKKLEEK